MANTYTQIYIQVALAVKGRESLIRRELNANEKYVFEQITD